MEAFGAHTCRPGLVRETEAGPRCTRTRPLHVATVSRTPRVCRDARRCLVHPICGTRRPSPRTGHRALRADPQHDAEARAAGLGETCPTATDRNLASRNGDHFARGDAIPRRNRAVSLQAWFLCFGSAGR